jgi:hypothetical protein
MQFIGFLLCIFKDFYCANLNTRVGRIDRPSMNSGTALANCELQIANSESLSVLRVLRGKKTLPRPPRPPR